MTLIKIHSRHQQSKLCTPYLVCLLANVSSAEETQWARLYETYQRLRAAKRRVDIKAGRVVEPILIGKVLPNRVSRTEISEK